MESVPAPRSDHGAGLTNLEYAPLVRDHGPLVDGSRGVQLLGARYRQYGGAGALRYRRTEEAMAGAAAGRQDALGLLHDGARSGIVRRHQYPVEHRARWRCVRDQRREVVVDGRRPSAVPDLDFHGQDRSRGGAAQAAVDDPGAARHAGGEDQTAAFRFRLQRSAARPCGDPVRECARAGIEHFAGRGPRFRDRAGPAGTRAHPPLHAADRRRPSARSN